MMSIFLLQAGEQAITSAGSISANWVLIGMTAIAFLLFGRLLWKIESNLEKVCNTVANHHTRLTVIEKELEKDPE